MKLPVAAALCLAALAGCAAPDDLSDPPVGAKEVGYGPQAVVGVIDTGINPYHITFRDPSPMARLHPSEYIPGYPAEAKPLNLTLRGDDYWDAVRSDCEAVWSKVQPGQLYYVPGTKIVGAIYFTPSGDTDCGGDEPYVGGILDMNGHGTMTASRATSFEYGACRECRVVAIQFPASVSFTGRPSPDGLEVTWTASNATWIDAQSNSWGPFLPTPFPDAAPQQYVGPSPGLARAVEEAAQQHLAFWASMNGAGGRLGAVGHPTLLSLHLTPSAISVGGTDSGRMNTWPGFPPHVVSDSCNSWAAHWDSMDASDPDVGGGTSGATPYAAGGAARMLLEARRLLGDNGTGVEAGVVARGEPGNITEGPLADGELTVAEWREVLFATATARPKQQYEDGTVCELTSAPYHSTPVVWEDVPEGYPEYLQIGYGAIDNESAALALAVLTGAAPLPDRSATDTFFAADAAARQAIHDAYTTMP